MCKIEKRPLSKVSPDLKLGSDWTLIHPHYPPSIITCAPKLYVSPVCFQEYRRQDSAGEWTLLTQSQSVDELAKEVNHFVSLSTRLNLYGEERRN